MENQICLIGCGWLGLPLAEQLQPMFKVVATSRAAEKCQLLNSKGIEAIEIKDNNWTLPEHVINSAWVVFMIPPSGLEDYVAFTKNSLHQFPSTTKVIFTSSIGVYEPSLEVINEQSNIFQNHPLVLVENYIQQTFAQTYSLRLAGLINAQRHPVKYLSGKENLNPNQVVNLVHQEDVIAAIQTIILEQPSEQTFNICYPAHPTRQDYYTQQAQKFNLPPPLFIDQTSIGKQIDGQRIESASSFRYTASIF
jgi:nucleoside-diphosphate-sugar epimerase